MARYFKFKTPADLQAEAETLGDSIALSDDFAPLFEPISIGGRSIGNRLAVQPMEGCDGTLDGHPDELTYRRYERFGAGGAKFLWGEATAIADEGRMNPRQLWLNDRTAGDIERMMEGGRQAHRHAFGGDSDLLFGLQLTHSGRYSCRFPQIAVRDPLVDPLTIDKRSGKPIDDSYPVLTDDDLKRIEDQYVTTAKLASQVGCDFIDLKQCHRYLLSELLGARSREGEYGGSLENRTRLVRNIIGRIREELPDLLIVTRLNVHDGVPHRKREGDGIGEPIAFQTPIVDGFGMDLSHPDREDLTEPIQVAKWLAEWGISLINISVGNPYANPHLVRPADYPPVDGYLPPEHPLLGVLRHFRVARAIQKAVPETPVMGSGYSWLQEFCMHAAAANVANGDVAMVGLGRGTLSHPDFAEVLRSTGKLNRKQVCRTFSYCTNLMRTKKHPLGQYATGCPPFDKETYGPLWKDAQAVTAGE